MCVMHQSSLIMPNRKGQCGELWTTDVKQQKLSLQETLLTIVQNPRVTGRVRKHKNVFKGK